MMGRDDRPWWDKYNETMQKASPPPSPGGCLFNLAMLASPVLGKILFGNVGLFIGLWIAVIGLSWFFFRRKK